MAKSLTLGNGEMLVGLDRSAQVQDLHFPYVGLENHVSRYFLHRIGLWVDGGIHWLHDHDWHVTVRYHDETFAGNTTAINNNIGIELKITDVVYNEKNILVREFVIRNLHDHNRRIKIFFGHEFQISESWRGDTGYFDPRSQSVIHYKGRRAFLVNAICEKKHFDDYSVGLVRIEGMEGTYRDAEDGTLSRNPVEHGAVDSVIGVTISVDGNSRAVVHYWLAAGQSIEEILDLNAYVLARGPRHLIRTTSDYWHAWVNKKNFTFHGLPNDVVTLFKKSLFVIRAHTDNRGSIIASGDSDILQYGRGTYSYVWPRDGARAAMAMVRAGDFNVARRFFEFCNSVITDEGYFMHKYRPDGSLGSSWHPWIRDGKSALPIQEDETAVVIGALWKYYEESRNIEFVESVYNSLIKKAADFLAGYVYKETGLPYPSYDVWEAKYGISTFTCGAKYDALIAAAKFAELLGKTHHGKSYRLAAERVKDAILKYLYNKERKMFHKLVTVQKDGTFLYDQTLDMSSLFSMFAFHVLPIEDARIRESVQTVEQHLIPNYGIGGMPRYEWDNYFRVGFDAPPNPWILTTLWLAQYYIDKAKREKDLDIVKQHFSWVAKYAATSGVLSEQLNPYTGEQIGATPLVWSHSEFVVSVVKYLERLEKMGVSRVCDPIE